MKPIERRKYKLTTLGLVLNIGLFCACDGNMVAKYGSNPIFLGDSTTIVTETDSQYLTIIVEDLALKDLKKYHKEAQKEVKAKDSIELKTKNDDIATVTPANDLLSMQHEGFKVQFVDVNVIFTQLEAKELRRQDPDNDPGVSYLITSGNIQDAKLIVQGLEQTKIRQRYQSNLSIKTKQGTLELNRLGRYTSDWTVLELQSKETEQISLLEGLNNIAYKQVTVSQLRNAAEHALKTKRLRAALQQEWNREIRVIKNTQDKRCQIEIDNVQWQISGKTKDGKDFFKTIRLDV